MLNSFGPFGEPYPHSGKLSRGQCLKLSIGKQGLSGALRNIRGTNRFGQPDVHAQSGNLRIQEHNCMKPIRELVAIGQVETRNCCWDSRPFGIKAANSPPSKETTRATSNIHSGTRNNRVPCQSLNLLVSQSLNLSVFNLQPLSQSVSQPLSLSSASRSFTRNTGQALNRQT